MSWENLFMPYANNKGADQPVHPCKLISAFVVCCLDSILPLVSIPEISSLYFASVDEQAGLCLTWSQTPKTGFVVTRLSCVLGFQLILRKWAATYDKINKMACAPSEDSDQPGICPFILLVLSWGGSYHYWEAQLLPNRIDLLFAMSIIY